MSEEQYPDVDEIKARLKEEIPVNEEPEAAKQQTGAEPGAFDAALRNLGQEFTRAVQSAWNSDQRKQVEQEIREGMTNFTQELEKVFREAKESPAGQKAQAEGAEFKTQFEQGEFAQKARSSIVQGLHWLSEGLGKLADQFEPGSEKAGDDGASPSSE